MPLGWELFAACRQANLFSIEDKIVPYKESNRQVLHSIYTLALCQPCRGLYYLVRLDEEFYFKEQRVGTLAELFFDGVPGVQPQLLATLSVVL